MPPVYDMECPHCGRQAMLEFLYSYPIGSGEFHFSFWKCMVCQLPIVISFEQIRGHPIKNFGNLKGNIRNIVGLREVVYFPEPRVYQIPRELPEAIRKVMSEANSNIKSRAFISTVAMCRKAIELVADDKGIKKGRLVDRIDEMETKKLIAPQLKDWAHEIRTVGNEALHEDPEAITEKDAKNIFLFTQLFLEYVYVLPEKIRKRREKNKDGNGSEES